MITIEVPWPRYSDWTATGTVSTSKRAGRKAIWMSVNNTHGMHSRLFTVNRMLWKTAAEEALRDGPYPIGYRVRIVIELVRNPASVMDVSAVIEGIKPLVDAMVESSFLVDDNPDYVVGFDALPVRRCKQGEDKVILTLIPA